jgi:hypothetical protein
MDRVRKSIVSESIFIVLHLGNEYAVGYDNRYIVHKTSRMYWHSGNWADIGMLCTMYQKSKCFHESFIKEVRVFWNRAGTAATEILVRRVLLV